MKLNEIADNPGSSPSRMRVGRGIGSGKGKTCGRGVKGQKARTGVAIKGFEGGQMPLHRRMPKRGFHSHFGTIYSVVNVSSLNAFDAGEVVTPELLRAAGLVRGKTSSIKVLGDGDLTPGLTVRAHAFSKSAADKIAKAGGKAEVL